MKQIIEQVSQKLKEISNLDSHKLSLNSLYETIPFNMRNFIEISKEIKEGIKIGFVDGGNSIISESSNYCLQFIRVYGCVFKRQKSTSLQTNFNDLESGFLSVLNDGEMNKANSPSLTDNKKINETKSEFFTLTHLENKSGKLFFKTAIYPLHSSNSTILPFEEDLFFNPDDETLKQGISNGEVSQIGGIARRYAELCLANFLTKFLDEKDVLILDGNLQPKYTNEEKYLLSLRTNSEDKKISVLGFSKTSNLYTDSGDNGLTYLSRISPFKAWIYVNSARPIKKSPYLFIAKLHQNSNPFKIESFDDNYESINKISSYCKDPIFQGYPYGLILADKYARVSNSEKLYLKTFIKTNLKSYEASKNAHEILDKISF